MAGAKEYLPGAKTTDAGSFQEAPARLHFDRERLGHVCRERRVARLDLFGSARRPSCPWRLRVFASLRQDPRPSVSQRLWHSQEMALSPAASWVRLNAASACRKRPVQCSQLCGAWRGFIPSSLSPTSTRPSGATRETTSATDHSHGGR